MKSRMKSRTSRHQIFDFLALLGALIFLLGTLVYLVIGAFTLGLEYGLRSLAACILPVIVITYVGSFTRLFQIGRPNQNFNVFFIYTLWTLMLLILGTTWNFTAIPLLELLTSTTLTSILWRTRKRASDSKLFACCYGVLAGALAFVCIFGIILRG